ncbi:MAG TPA: adenosylcobinamide-GDP ribazoletransferase [Xanthobacteraceae bacterium]|jgi:adenosylcobinamide-GDP ribazoletransferase|nr:adenosylcobinamide-GDP ribazoletransferase [Xanthobacteraceae bacterium]
MKELRARIRKLVADFLIGLMFYTRLPLGGSARDDISDFARASWTAPVVGAVVGILGAIAFDAASKMGLPPLPAAVIAVATTLLLTGGLHEDGLADTADGFGGGATRERKLEIMRDSRIGTYGVCAVVISLMLRVSALAALAGTAFIVPALIASHTAARSLLPAFMYLMPPARADGLSASAGRPPFAAVFVSVLIGLIALRLGLGASHAIIAVALLIALAAIAALMSKRQIGGQTGDVLGAVEQAGEVLVLLVAVTLKIAI